MTPDSGPESVPHADGMPRFGLGTWQNTDPGQCAESVATALEMGYRHVDTAQIYDNEAAVGEGLARASVDRDDVFLATKVWKSNLSPEEVVASTEESLDRLGVDYVDLLYVHWPAGDYEPEATMAAFDDLHDRGLIERVGVSNFTPEMVDAAREALDAPLFANQVEMHPYLQQDRLLEYAAETHLEIVAYSPLARGRVMDDPVLSDIAEAQDVSEAQVSLAWLRTKGVTAIPKARSEAHIADNLRSLDLDLTESEIARIDDIDRAERLIEPDFAPDAW